MVQEITVLGGGTAGLTSALIIKSAYPDIKVNLIKSEKIDIVGVGEGTTEHWREFIDFCKLSPEDFFIHCGSTFKHGINFVNWNGDGKSYLHNVPTYIINQDKNSHCNVIHKLIVENEDANMMIDKFIIDSMHYQPVIESTNQYHFDTFKLNNFLTNKCEQRQINVITDTIKDVVIDSITGNVKELVGEKQNYNGCLFVDASGFHRVLHKHTGSNWKDCTEYLPMNSAITFPTALDDEFPAYTKATAMDNGWVWQIPTQERYGNGYVYCDEYCTEEQAIAEVTNAYGFELDIKKKFKFGAGYLTNPWSKNVIAVGLSASFIEPLEATNIGTAIQQAFGIVHHLDHYQTAQQNYNRKITKVFENTVDFVQLHYFTNRKDTEFWKSTSSIKKTDFNEETFEVFKTNIPNWTYFDNQYCLFNQYNWIMVMAGLGLLDRKKYIEDFNRLPYESKMQADVKLDVYFSRQEPALLTHREAINYIQEKYSA